MGLVLYIAITHGFHLSEAIYVLIMLLAPLLNLAYFLLNQDQKSSEKESIVSLWIECKRQKLKNEINKIKKEENE